MPGSTTRLAIGAAIALGMAIVGLSAIGTTLNVPQTLANLDEVSETDAHRDRQELRRYFIQERRDLRERLPSL